LQFLNPFRTGKLVLYQTKYTRGWHDFEMVPFCLLGILGVCGQPFLFPTQLRGS
jgi:chloride channel 3/4/5